MDPKGGFGRGFGLKLGELTSQNQAMQEVFFPLSYEKKGNIFVIKNSFRKEQNFQGFPEL